jgi:hypothetical protein
VVDVAAAAEAHVRAWFPARSSAEASVTFVGVDPVRVLRFGPDEPDSSGEGLVRYVTIGCSRYPMGDPNDLLADPVKGPRAELVLTLRGGVDAVLRPLAVIAAAPVVEGLVLAPDALVDLSEPLWPGAAFTAVLLGESELADLPSPAPIDPVRFLSVTPVTATEAAWVRLRGAAALREAWDEAGIDVTDPARSAVRMQ